MSLNDQIYTPSSTDITLLWRQKYGYIPASEQPAIKKKWADFKALMAKGIEDIEPVVPPKALKPIKALNLVELKKYK
jgi:hypothetical protein